MASLLPELPGGKYGKILALKEDLSSRGFLQAQDAAGGGGLAAAALAYQPDRLTGVYVKTNPVDGVDGMGALAIVFV
jgi:hypothetical protein